MGFWSGKWNELGFVVDFLAFFIYIFDVNILLFFFTVLVKYLQKCVLNLLLDWNLNKIVSDGVSTAPQYFVYISELFECDENTICND